MKPPWQVLLGLSIIAALEPAARADDGGRPHSDVRLETGKLLQADAKRIALSAKEAPPTPAIPPNATPPGAVVMAPYVLRTSKVPEMAIRNSGSGFARFVDDGTVYRHVGTKFTTTVNLQYYVTGLLRAADPLPAGPVRMSPKNGIQLMISFAW